MALNSYKDLVVWQKAMDLVVEIYALVSILPREELYGITNQMKRASVSIPSNIAEGYRRHSKPDQAQFFTIAYASGAELETQIEICKKLKFTNNEQSKKSETLLDEVMRMLNALTASRR